MTNRCLNCWAGRGSGRPRRRGVTTGGVCPDGPVYFLQSFYAGIRCVMSSPWLLKPISGDSRGYLFPSSLSGIKKGDRFDTQTTVTEGCQYWGCWVEGVWETLYDSSNVFSFFFEFGSVNGKNTATHILNLTNSGEADAAALQTQRPKVNTRDGCPSKFRTKSGSRPEVTSLACSFLGLK